MREYESKNYGTLGTWDNSFRHDMDTNSTENINVNVNYDISNGSQYVY